MKDENIIGEVKRYDDEGYIKINKGNLSTILNGIDINAIDLFGYDLYKNKRGLVKITYTDIDNPFVIEKDLFSGYKLNINPDYYLEHKDECQSIINYIISNCKEQKFSIKHKGLLNYETIKSLCENKNIEITSVEKYSNNPYILSVEDYKIFKKYNKKIDTIDVCDELRDNFDNTILYNSKRNLIAYYNYEKLINLEEMYIHEKLSEDELKYIKFINKNTKIFLDFDDYDYVFKIIDLVEKNNGNNSYCIQVGDKEKFNKCVFEHNINKKNVRVETNTFDDVSLDEYLNFEKLLYQIVEPARGLSNFEKYLYAYNITKQFKTYKENKNDLDQSRNLYNILTNEYMVCVGYSNMLGDLLNKLGIPSMKLSIDVDISYDNVNKNNEYVEKKDVTVKAGHARRYVNLVDEKYGINGFYVSDPTWDNDLQNDYYNHSVMTDRESNMSSRYQWSNNYDIFDVNNINEYYERVKNKFNKNDYKDFCNYFKNIIEEVGKLDGKFYNNLKEKYSFITQFGSRWPDDITSLVNDLGVYILNKVNKTISGEKLFSCIRNLYLNNYGYNEDNVDEILESVRKYNKERQEISFPTRKRVNEDGTKEIIMNENNKFDFHIDVGTKTL